MVSVKDVRRHKFFFNYIEDFNMKNTLKEDGVVFLAQEIIADIEYTDDGTLRADSTQKAQNIIE